MKIETEIPVITIDGPSGSGKGTIAANLASELNWHMLDSGALYRVLGYVVEEQALWEKDTDRWAELAESMPIHFEFVDGRTQAFYQGRNIEPQIRSEEAGERASRVAVVPEVRSALLALQRSFARAPGLVADGRDMGTRVFPAAPLKIYLTASAEERAKRRYLQLKKQGENVSLAALLKDIKQRDVRDMQRDASPLIPAADAIELDSTRLAIEEVVAAVLKEAQKRQIKP